MGVKDNGPRRFDDLVERPRVAPVEEMRAQLDRVETRADVRNHPEDEPHRCPRLTDDHGNVLARQAKSGHSAIFSA